MSDISDKLKQIVTMIEAYGMIDGAHHKQWLLTEILKICLGEKGFYEWEEKFNEDEDYDEWDGGIPP
jgi:hypothetical protein